MAAGLPTARAPGGERRAIEVVERDPVTCAPTDAVAAAAGLARERSTSSVLVINDERIVLGRLTHRHLTEAAERVAQDVMESGLTTVRAHEPLDALFDRMAANHVQEMIVTTLEGVLLGVINRSD